jgi:hypothetical protein
LNIIETRLKQQEEERKRIKKLVRRQRKQGGQKAMTMNLSSSKTEIKFMERSKIQNIIPKILEVSEKICPTCNSKFTKKYNSQIYCSTDCRELFKEKRRDKRPSWCMEGEIERLKKDENLSIEEISKKTGISELWVKRIVNSINNTEESRKQEEEINKAIQEFGLNEF